MSRMQVDGDAIRALAALLDETGLSEIEIAEKEHRIRVARAAPPLAQAVPAPAAAASSSNSVTATSTPASAADHPGTVKSPMVGVVYLSPDPSAPPFVQVGQSVTEGQTLLLIEAMKTFNQVKAPRAGKVLRVLISNGDPVEFGEPLAIIE